MSSRFLSQQELRVHEQQPMGRRDVPSAEGHMKHATTKELFDFISKRVLGEANTAGVPSFRAFPRWFAQMYYSRPEEMFASDGTGDGKVDFFFHPVAGSRVTHHVINSKFTETYNQTAPVGFYDEVLAFYQLFNEPIGRGKFLQKKVKSELHPFYKNLFNAFDNGKADLLFLTNCRKNAGQFARIEKLDVETFHLENLIQHVLDDLDGAMPRTPDLTLHQIGTTLSPPTEETGVSTTLVFARLADFVDYMDNDPYDLLFARNVRVTQGNTIVNKAISETFVDHPEQFAYSSNGLTLLCERATHNHGSHELLLLNPRVVNGSQTLHSVRAACASGLPHGAKTARVMVRIVTIPPALGVDAPGQAAETKEIINRISIRSNQQNPIKAWDLRANDDFQMEISRRFRHERLFYERRSKEWRTRSSQLKSVGVSRGPSIKALMAQVACYHWRNPKLGPALAKGNVGEIFQGEGYDVIRESTSSELAFQVHMVFEDIDWSLRRMKQKKYRIARRHIDLAVLSLVCRTASEQKAAWGKPDWTIALMQQKKDGASWDKPWLELTRKAADVVLTKYAAALHRARLQGDDLTLKNFVRRRDEIKQILTAPLQKGMRHAVRAVLPNS
jgi:hypothetical protein